MSQGTSAAQALADLQASEAAIAAQNTNLSALVTAGIAQLTALIQSLQAGSGVAVADVENVVTLLKTDATNEAAVAAAITTAEQQNLPAKS